MKPYRILVTGDRKWQDSLYLFDTLSALRNENPIQYIIEGGAKGADQVAGIWAILSDTPLMVFPADWDKYQRAAGPIRNTQMLKEGMPNLVCGFHTDIQKSKGTANMLHQSKIRGIKTLLFTGRGRSVHVVCPGPAFFSND